jgi:WhiB family transcriptional regulator, redox-sensing transcriptional regulator
VNVNVSYEAIEWKYDQPCGQVDGDTFYPEKGHSAEPAKAICRTCDVVDQCLRYALENDERWGVWGGLSERERRKIKRAEKAEERARRTAVDEPDQEAA